LSPTIAFGCPGTVFKPPLDIVCVGVFEVSELLVGSWGVRIARNWAACITVGGIRIVGVIVFIVRGRGVHFARVFG
jgi:hypothetical protein